MLSGREEKILDDVESALTRLRKCVSKHCRAEQAAHWALADHTARKKDGAYRGCVEAACKKPCEKPNQAMGRAMLAVNDEALREARAKKSAKRIESAQKDRKKMAEGLKRGRLAVGLDIL